MKTCSKCNTDNVDNALHCRGCGAKLEECEKKKNAEEYIEEIFRREEQRERRNRIIAYISMICFSIIYLPFLVVCTMTDIEMLFWGGIIFVVILILFDLCVLHPKVLFWWEMMFKVDNIDDVEPTSWFYITSKISGYLILVVGIIFILWLVYSFEIV